MAFTLANLHRVGSQNRNGPSLWLYATSDALTAVDASGYFNDVAAKFKVGDWVLVSSSSTYGISIVTGNTRDLTATPPVEGVVDVTNHTAVGAIDSD
jgi:hypothetical protein